MIYEVSRRASRLAARRPKTTVRGRGSDPMVLPYRRVREVLPWRDPWKEKGASTKEATL